ncbi:hypothetical protein BpHYR1_010633 [Brachionus plicatilis]|uniref:Uncharacterized protein n=1 Tax=Brachionus plicatilis TaxID=10195 RepID=A0A3M7S6K1_BRAPC|nr:hypothetical protein BpHYR1_010633 [Brachionus plicatilis]
MGNKKVDHNLVCLLPPTFFLKEKSIAIYLRRRLLRGKAFNNLSVNFSFNKNEISAEYVKSKNFLFDLIILSIKN